MQISTVERPEALVGTPTGQAVTKERSALTDMDRDTLRINGRAGLVGEAPCFDDMAAVRGTRPVLTRGPDDHARTPH